MSQEPIESFDPPNRQLEAAFARLTKVLLAGSVRLKRQSVKLHSSDDCRAAAAGHAGMLAHPKLLKLAILGLELSQDDVSEAAGVSLRSLQRLESYPSMTNVQTIQSVQRALERRGVTFLGEGEEVGSGFRLPRGFLTDK
jgi:hypothetical protein